MRKIFHFFFIALFLVGSAAFVAAEEKGGVEVESINIDKSTSGYERVLVQLNGVVDPIIFELPGGNPRIVCDLKNAKYPPDQPKVVDFGGKLIEKVRVGLHNEPELKTRIVIDLAKGIDYDHSHLFDYDNNILSITIQEKKSEKKVAPVDQKKSSLSPEKPQQKIEQSVESKTAQLELEKIENPVAKSTDTPEPQASAPVPEPALPSKEKTEDLPLETIAKSDKLEALGSSGEVIQREDAVKEIPVLLDVNYDRNTTGQEMVLFKLSGFHPPVVYSTDKGELRVVCDFLDSELEKKGEPEILTEGNYIRRIRISKHNDPKKVRVVLDLEEKYNYDLKQVFFKEENLFVVIISNAGEK